MQISLSAERRKSEFLSIIRHPRAFQVRRRAFPSPRSMPCRLHHRPEVVAHFARRGIARAGWLWPGGVLGIGGSGCLDGLAKDPAGQAGGDPEHELHNDRGAAGPLLGTDSGFVAPGYNIGPIVAAAAHPPAQPPAARESTAFVRVSAFPPPFRSLLCLLAYRTELRAGRKPKSRLRVPGS